MPIFRVKSVKIYTGQKNLHWRRRPRRRQLSGMEIFQMPWLQSSLLALLPPIIIHFHDMQSLWEKSFVSFQHFPPHFSSSTSTCPARRKLPTYNFLLLNQQCVGSALSIWWLLLSVVYMLCTGSVTSFSPEIPSSGKGSKKGKMTGVWLSISGLRYPGFLIEWMFCWIEYSQI